MLKDTLQADLKAAMLSGDKVRVSALNMLKGAILNQEIADGTRETGLTDDQAITVLSKEYKKRLDAAELYKQSGSQEKADSELFEADIIKAYLPKQLDDAEIEAIVDQVIDSFGDASMQDMGKIIGAVKAKAGATADGARVASLVKEKLTN